VLYKGLHFKLVLMLVLFIIIIISIIATVMLNGVFDFYTKNFNSIMSQTLNDDMLKELCEEMDREDFYIDQQNKLRGQYGNLGIKTSRQLYILDMNGKYLTGTDDKLGQSLIKTPNMLAAMDKRVGDKQSFGSDYMDYAVYISSDMFASSSQKSDGAGQIYECIIYIKDTQEEMRDFSWKIFEIVVQVLLVGLAVAVFLSFFLAKAITSPIQSITKGAVKLADGDFKRKIEISSNDEIGTLALTFNDMAEKLKATHDEISGEREKLEIIFLYHNDGVLVFSSDGVLNMINQRGVEILKDDYRDNMDFESFMNLFHLDFDENDETEKTGEISSSDKNTGRILRNAAYRENIFDVSIGKFKYGQDSESIGSKLLGGTIVVIHDVTQSYALEKSRREFIANVSHELKTPLTTILIAAESISDGRMSEEIKIDFLNRILSEGARMTRIVQDLLVVSRLDNKKMMWQFTSVNAEEMGRRIYDTMRVEADKSEQTLTLNTGENIPVIYADKARIEQVLINIISNAIKYTPSGGKIEFSIDGYKLKRENTDITGVKFTIKDNGIGIPREDLPHIFERFYRVEKARSTEAGGTGLGLSIAKEIVLAHKGQITLDPAVGGGTVVTIILPRNSDENKT